jgi:hypothetical protein
MNGNAALKFAPVFSDNKRIDLAIESDETVIQLSIWTEGLGWCTQKTMRLDAGLLDELHRVVTAARIRNKSITTDENVSADTAGKVLSFPAMF